LAAVMRGQRRRLPPDTPNLQAVPHPFEAPMGRLPALWWSSIPAKAFCSP